MSAVLLSLEVASLATVVAAVFSLGLSALLAHRRAVLIDALLTTPLVLPPTVLGYWLLVSLGQNGVLHDVFGITVAFTKTGVVVAAVLTSLPLMLQTMRAAVESVDVTLIEAARTLGASGLSAFIRITVPLASRGITAGIVLGFARALGDFGVTLMVGGNLPGETQTASLALYGAFIAGRSTDAAWLAATMTSLAFVLIAISTWLARRPHA